MIAAFMVVLGAVLLGLLLRCLPHYPAEEPLTGRWLAQYWSKVVSDLGPDTPIQRVAFKFKIAVVINNRDGSSESFEMDLPFGPSQEVLNRAERARLRRRAQASPFRS